MDHRRRRPALVGDALDVLPGENAERDVPSPKRVRACLLEKGHSSVALGRGWTARLDVADEVVLLVKYVVPVRRGSGDDEVVLAGGQADVSHQRSPTVQLLV